MIDLLELRFAWPRAARDTLDIPALHIAAGEALFDLVLSSGVVSFSGDFARFYAGLTRAVAPGGTLVIGDLNPHSRGMRKRRSERQDDGKTHGSFPSRMRTESSISSRSPPANRVARSGLSLQNQPCRNGTAAGCGGPGQGHPLPIGKGLPGRPKGNGGKDGGDAHPLHCGWPSESAVPDPQLCERAAKLWELPADAVDIVGEAIDDRIEAGRCRAGSKWIGAAC